MLVGSNLQRSSPMAALAHLHHQRCSSQVLSASDSSLPILMFDSDLPILAREGKADDAVMMSTHCHCGGRSCCHVTFSSFSSFSPSSFVSPRPLIRRERRCSGHIRFACLPPFT